MATRVAPSKSISASGAVFPRIGAPEHGHAQKRDVQIGTGPYRQLRASNCLIRAGSANAKHQYGGPHGTESAVAVVQESHSQTNNRPSGTASKVRTQKSGYAPAAKQRTSPGWAKSAAEPGLLERARSGDSAAFGELSERCRLPLLRTAWRILRDEADAQDSVQDSLLSAFVNLRTFDGRSTFLTWATRITINCSLMRLRIRQKHYKKRVEAEIDEGCDKTACPTLSPEQAVGRDEQERQLLSAIASLPEKYRTVIEIKELQDRTFQETASLLGIPVPTTKARVFRAKGLLKRRLASMWRLRCQCPFEPQPRKA